MRMVYLLQKGDERGCTDINERKKLSSFFGVLSSSLGVIIGDA
jgi:hypothetical protein